MQYQHLAWSGAINELSARLCTYYGKKFTVTFSNATTAIQTTCLAIGLKKKEVITSPLNWGGSIAPILLHDNKLRFTSIDPISKNLNANDLKNGLTSKTKAVLSVDYGGTPADSNAIRQFCKDQGLVYISDSAQSFGAYHKTNPAGYYADVTVLSFSPGKSLFAGEGGAVLTDDPDIYEKLIWYSQHPSIQKTVFGLSNYNEYLSINGRMNPLSAILLNETFESSLTTLKEYQSRCYDLLIKLQKENLIEKTPNLSTPNSSTFFNFIVKHKASISIEHLSRFLKDNNLPFSAVPLHLNFIPFDKSFKNQFKNKFSCSVDLVKQKSSTDFTNLITLQYSP